MTLTIRLSPVIAWLALLSTPAIAQKQADDFKNFNPRFEVFELPGGVFGNSVQGIVQDSAGFLWFAFQEGLHCYDGQTLFTYRNDPLDSNSILSDYCEYIFLDSKGVIWLVHYNDGGVTDFDPAVGMVEVIPQDIGRVFLNLVNNAFYAVQQRKMQEPEGFEPTVSVSSHMVRPLGGQGAGGVEFRIKDNGTGIPNDVKTRIFQPFFTTKPTGQGTGLGLSLAYDIVVKGHGGTLEVESTEGEGTEFIIILPTV